MKRNETVLVYAVTGLLIVILGIAVIFGEDADARGKKDGDKKVVKNDEDLGIMDEDNVPGVGNVGTRKPEQKQPEQKKPEVEDDEKDDVQVPPAKKEPVVKNVPLVSPKTAAEEVVARFGTSARDGSYRQVKARAGDRLRTLVRRWCGSDDAELLAEAEGLNETYREGKAIPGGSPVLLPWVDDEALLEKHKTMKPAKAPTVVNQPAAVTIYTVKPGDNLWKIAVKRVGARKAPAYIQKIAQANPEIENLDYLKEKQKLRLPR